MRVRRKEWVGHSEELGRKNMCKFRTFVYFAY